MILTNCFPKLFLPNVADKPNCPLKLLLLTGCSKPLEVRNGSLFRNYIFYHSLHVKGGTRLVLPNEKQIEPVISRPRNPRYGRDFMLFLFISCLPTKTASPLWKSRATLWKELGSLNLNEKAKNKIFLPTQ